MENMNRIQQFSTSIPSKRIEFEYAPRKVKIRMEKQKTSISYLGLEKLQELIENYLGDDTKWVGPKCTILEWKTRNRRTNQRLPKERVQVHNEDNGDVYALLQLWTNRTIPYEFRLDSITLQQCKNLCVREYLGTKIGPIWVSDCIIKM